MGSSNAHSLNTPDVAEAFALPAGDVEGGQPQTQERSRAAVANEMVGRALALEDAKRRRDWKTVENKIHELEQSLQALGWQPNQPTDQPADPVVVLAEAGASLTRALKHLVEVANRIFKLEWQAPRSSSRLQSEFHSVLSQAKRVFSMRWQRAYRQLGAGID